MPDVTLQDLVNLTLMVIRDAFSEQLHRSMGAYTVLLLFVRSTASSCPSDLDSVTVTHTITITEKCAFSVSRCRFVGISGTAITTQASRSVVFVSDSSFESCTNYVSSSSTGGACYLQVLNATLVRCCGYKCSASAQGQFYRSIRTEWSIASELCALLCGGTKSDSQDTIQVEDGKHILERVNASLNTAPADGAAFESYASSDCRISQFSVVNCQGKGIIGLCHWDTSSVRFNCFMFNVINNTVVQASDTYGLVHFGCRWHISTSAFFGNSQNQILRHKNFESHPSEWASSFITLIDCVSDAEITGDAFELVNHQIETEITKTHGVLVLVCEYLETPVFMENLHTTRVFVCFQFFVHLI